MMTSPRPLLCALLLVSLGLVVAGCESSGGSGLTARVRETFTGPVYQQRTYTAEPAAVFAAARTATAQLGFTPTRIGEAQGVIEGLDRIVADDTLRGGRQRAVMVRVTPEVAVGVRVEVLFTEVIEDDFNKGAGLPTRAPLRESPLYPIFFRTLEQALPQ